MKIVTAEHGTDEAVVDVNDLHVHDLWPIATSLPIAQRNAILEVWYLAHDMRAALQALARAETTESIVHTKPYCPPAPSGEHRGE